MKKWLTASRRRYLYRVAQAALAVAIGYGLLDGNEAALWLLAIGAVLEVSVQNVNDED